MEELKRHLNQQFLYNKLKNVFCNESLSDFGFSPAIKDYLKSNLQSLKQMSVKDEETLGDYLADKAIASFSQANQFYHFDSFDRERLRRLYKGLLSRLRGIPVPVEDEALEAIAKQHYRSLQSWLKQSNPFAKLLYKNSEPYLDQEVVCAEYTAQAQLELLNINLAVLQEPVLDLGCGSQAFLVKLLRSMGVEAYGIDRNVTPTEYLLQSDWFEFDLVPERWGTIISNLGFSNHFQHHHLRAGGDYTRYARRFMEILQSMKVGGTFYYAPDLPFIEQYLDASTFDVQKIAVQDTPYFASKILKLQKTF
ncbi:class I SAM-dependent methyltransferase [Pontibacter korlensis]|uniref:class I SAM-dependent methyltransferase n=1 Tax=Pontibacter korlensis TaxID=400092 RepID=UPI0006990D68|nr:class I SAM-dependent methyltransferase [Pontibacter korlensis]